MNVSHAARVFENFYGIDRLGRGVMALLGIAELLLILAFVAGYQKRMSYGGVLILHAISTVSSYRQYLGPFNNLLFFTAWTMLATCVALYLLRDFDTRWSVDAATHRRR